MTMMKQSKLCFSAVRPDYRAASRETPQQPAIKNRFNFMTCSTWISLNSTSALRIITITTQKQLICSLMVLCANVDHIRDQYQIKGTFN